jgi:hypothetical protein
MYNGFDFGKTEIFFRLGLDRAETQAVADLPVGQISLVGKGAFSLHRHSGAREARTRNLEIPGLVLRTIPE